MWYLQNILSSGWLRNQRSFYMLISTARNFHKHALRRWQESISQEDPKGPRKHGAQHEEALGPCWWKQGAALLLSEQGVKLTSKQCPLHFAKSTPTFQKKFMFQYSELWLPQFVKRPIVNIDDIFFFFLAQDLGSSGTSQNKDKQRNENNRKNCFQKKNHMFA